MHRVPDMIYIRVINCNRVLVEGYPSGIFGIPAKRYRLKLSLPNPEGVSKTWSPSDTGFNIITAYAITPEKVHGETIGDGIVITPLERGGHLIPPASLYVAFY